jgi:hypothetical protein
MRKYALATNPAFCDLGQVGLEMVRSTETKTKRARTTPPASRVAHPSPTLTALPQYMTQTEYARHAGVHAAQVTRWINMTKGSPLPHIVAAGKKKILVKEADVWRAGYLKPHVTAAKIRSAQKREIEAGQKPADDEINIEREMAKVRLREMQLRVQESEWKAQERLGHLVAREPLLQALQALFGQFKARIMELPQALGDEVSAETGVEAALVRRVCDRVVREYLSDFASSVQKIAVKKVGL